MEAVFVFPNKYKVLSLLINNSKIVLENVLAKGINIVQIFCINKDLKGPWRVSLYGFEQLVSRTPVKVSKHFQVNAIAGFMQKKVEIRCHLPSLYENCNTFDDYHSSSYPRPEAKSMQKTKKKEKKLCFSYNLK